MRVPVYERQIGIQPMPQPNIQPVMPTGDGGASVFKAIQGFTDRLIKLQEDHEDAQTLEAFNKFKNDSLDYHENPEKGIYNTRLGGAAKGVYSEADGWMRTKGEEYAQRLGSNRAKANFRRMASDYISQRGQTNSRFEAEQSKKYRIETADAAIKNGLNEIATNAFDDSAVDRIRNDMMSALELKTRYSSPETRKAALAEMENSIALTRLNTMLQENPLMAESWFNANKDKFTGDDAVKAAQVVKNRTEIFKTQSAVDELIKKFPQGHEQEGLKWIREHYSGDEEERIAAAFKTRHNEIEVDENKNARLLKLQQDQFEDRLANDLYVNGRLPSEYELREYVRTGRLRAEQAERLQTQQITSASRDRIEREILARNPDFSQLELDQAVMSRMGTTNEDHQKTFAEAVQLVLNAKPGDNVNKKLEYLYKRGKLTREDVDTLKKQGDIIDDTQREFLNGEKKDLDAIIKNLVKAGLPDKLSQGIRDNFLTQALTKNPRDKDYRQQILDLKKRVLIDAITNSGERLTGYLWGQSALGEALTEIQDMTLENRNIDPFPTLPDIQPSNITLTPQARPAPVPANQTPRLERIPTNDELPTLTGEVDLSSSFYLGNYRVTDGYSLTPTALRNGRGHAAIDRALPPNTPLIIPNGHAWTVAKTGRNSTAGKHVTISTTLSNGDNLSVTLAHLNDYYVRRGDIINPGEMFARSGNTGNSTGPHLHISAKLNGQTINPSRVNMYDVTVNNNIAPPAPAPVSPDVQQVPERLSSQDIFSFPTNPPDHYIQWP